MQDEVPTPALRRELFARFGLAYYHSECLHKELCNFLAISAFPSRDGITRPRIEERLAQAFALPLGLVVCELRPLLGEDFLPDLEAAVKKRNFLAHHFWFERAHLMFTVSGIDKMIEELDAMSEQFHRLDEKCTKGFAQKRKELGVTDEMIQSALEECMAGKRMEPLPTQRKVKKQERVIRSWEFVLPNGQKPLVFETEDGCLWQLCDVGLGWTYYDSIQEDWKENEDISKYLPATLNPRPARFQQWHYELNLSKGAILWVRPGSREKTFKWGIRTKH
jgi:hypothetical protein